MYVNALFGVILVVIDYLVHYLVFIMVLDTYAKKRALSLHFQGYTISSIVDHLCLEDGILISKQGLHKFRKRYAE